jgi:hypothetical protein
MFNRILNSTIPDHFNKGKAIHYMVNCNYLDRYSALITSGYLPFLSAPIITASWYLLNILYLAVKIKSFKSW